jgi:hypothetical protein
MHDGMKVVVPSSDRSIDGDARWDVKYDIDFYPSATEHI